jgi:hypothetical protein
MSLKDINAVDLCEEAHSEHFLSKSFILSEKFFLRVGDFNPFKVLESWRASAIFNDCAVFFMGTIRPFILTNFIDQDFLVLESELYFSSS